MPGLDRARIAVVHDWLIDYAGSERVLAEILRCFPGAHLFTLVDRMPAQERARLGAGPATTTFLQRMPGVTSGLQYYLPLMPLAVEQLDVTGYDLVVSSSHAVAKGVIPSPDALHISYVHSPMRYAWDLQAEYLPREGFARGARECIARWMLHWLRAWDQRSAARVDRFVANSAFVARRILKTYRRHADVIHPPVDIDRFAPGGARGDDYVTVGRLWPYKRIDLLVRAFAALPERRLTVIGSGPELGRLRRIAPPNVELTGHLDDAALVRSVAGARAFLFAATEDFGIAPVEAMACGTPVIAYRRGGAAETVAGLEDAAPTGAFFDEASPEAVAAAIRRFESEAHRVTAQACRSRAERYSAARFRAELTALVSRTWDEWQAFRRGDASAGAGFRGDHHREQERAE